MHTYSVAEIPFSRREIFQYDLKEYYLAYTIGPSSKVTNFALKNNKAFSQRPIKKLSLDCNVYSHK